MVSHKLVLKLRKPFDLCLIIYIFTFFQISLNLLSFHCSKSYFLELKITSKCYATTIMLSNLTITNANTSNSMQLQVKYVTFSEWCLVVAFILIMCMGVVGNAFVIYVFGCKRKSNQRSATDWLILYLGIIDLLSSFLNPPLYIYWTLTHYRRWDFGDLGCHILPSLGPIMASVSSGVLLIFAINRYLAIVAPFRGELSRRTVTIAFFIDIILSTGAYLHYILALTIHPKYKYCYIPDVSDYKYGIPNCTFIILRLCVFATVFGFTNVRIFKTLKRYSSASTSRELRASRLKQSKRIMLVLLTMGAVFTLLVFPRELFYLVYNLSWLVSINGIKFTPMSLEINSWLKVAHTANSCANVFIYSKMQTIYRKQIFRILLCFGCCKRALSRRNFSVTQMSLMGEKRFLSSHKNNHECKKVLLIHEEDSTSSNETVFFQRAQQWKQKIDPFNSVFL